MPNVIQFNTVYDDVGNIVSVTADHFPELLYISMDLLNLMDKRFVERDNKEFTFKLANGIAKYRIVGWANHQVWITERILLEEKNADQDSNVQEASDPGGV